MSSIQSDSDYVNEPFETSFDLDDYIPYRILKTQLWMHRAIQYEKLPRVKAIASISKTEVRIIMMVVKHQGVTPSQIAEVLGFDRAIVTRTISSLAKKDLILTKASNSDQRSKALFLTARGADLCSELIKVFEDFTQKIENVLEPNEKETLVSILNKLIMVSQENK